MSSDANRPRASSDGSSELASGHRVKQDAEGQGATRHPREGQPAWKWPLTQVLFCVSMLILGYDVSNIANIQPPIYEAFGHVELLPWVAIGYSSLCAAVALWLRQFAFFLPLKTLFVTYQGLAMLGAAVSGAAPNINAVIIGRAIIGIGCGGVYQLGTTYNALLSTPAEFPRVQGYAGVSWVIGLILGPIIGGAFAENQHATWRWAIYINLPVFAVIMALTLICLPAIQLEPNAPIFKRLSQMDWIGIVLHFAFTVLLCMALIFSGSTWPWNSGAAIAVWVVIGLVFIVYSTQQMKPFFTTRERQLFPVGLVKLHRSIILVCLSTASIGGTYGVTLYYTPLFFAFARGFEPVAAAVRLLPYIGVFIVSMLVATGILPAVRYYSPFYIVGGALVMIGAGVQTMITPETSDARVMGIQAIIAFGTGLMWQTGTGILNQLVSASARTPAEASRHRMDAAAMFVTFQLGGVAVVLSVAGCIFENLGYDLVRDSISGLGDFGPEDIREALAGVDSKLLLQETSPLLKSAVVHAVTTVLARIQWLVFAGGLVAFICGWCMPFEALDFSMGSANAAEAKAAAAAAPAAPVAAPAGVMTAAPETPASSQPVDTEKHAT